MSSPTLPNLPERGVMQALTEWKIPSHKLIMNEQSCKQEVDEEVAHALDSFGVCKTNCA